MMVAANQVFSCNGCHPGKRRRLFRWATSTPWAPPQLPIRRVRARLRGYETAYAYMVDAIGHALERWEHGAGPRRLATGGKR